MSVSSITRVHGVLSTSSIPPSLFTLENIFSPDKEYNHKKPTKARFSRSIDGKENIKMVWTCSKDGVGKKTKISAGGKTRRRKRKGRPRVEWEEYVERMACKRGRKLPEVKRLAQDRKEFRKCLLEPDA
jgi:hypothetical protein